MDHDEGTEVEECQRCGKLCEPVEIDACPFCGKKFCPYCSHRIASRNFCSPSCGKTYFFLGEDEDDGIDE